AAESAIGLSAARLNLISRVSGAIVGSAPLNEQAQDLANQVRIAFGVDACILRHLDGDELVLLASSDPLGIQVDERLPVDGSVTGQIVKRQEPLVIGDLAKQPLLSAKLRQRVRSRKIRLYAGAPMMIEGHVTGVVGILTADAERTFTDADIQHLQILANHAAILLENDRLFREL